MGIIGIVAALTIPTLISDYQERVTVTKMKKIFSTFSNAYQLYLVDNTHTKYNFSEESAKEIFNIFAPYLKISKDCGTESGDGCIYTGNYKLKNGTETGSYANNNKNYYKIRLSDGSSIWLRGGNSDIYDIIIFYDLNGESGPNQWGYDLFEFLIKDYKVFPNGLDENSVDNYFDNACAPANSSGYGCAAWVIQQGNFDYLKCDDLSLKGKTKCTN